MQCFLPPLNSNLIKCLLLLLWSQFSARQLVFPLFFYCFSRIINNARTHKQTHSKQIPLPLLSQLKIPLENQGMANAKLISTLLLCMVVTAPMMNIEASIQCHTVTVALATCLGYFTKGGRVPSSCCKGAQNVKNAARTTKDRRETCACLKRAAGQYRVNFKFAAALPAVCKVHIPYRISPSINCNSIQ
ncbi:hypothetical protein OIU85_028682 [Salix viminalis]|uniref:Non-specific lipid-transfer protein n=2 Tax=Salix viminalis TaxID=40686 RepID=A0A9Q0QLG6_SALVM|nr:hypothetical protein OIU85_028682 [Salix viminalis]